MPDLVVAEIWRERVGFSEGEEQWANGERQSACEQQCDGAHAKLGVDGVNEKDNDPAHEQKAEVGHPDRDLREENGFKCDEENGQTPNDPEQHPACRAAEDGEAEWRVGSCNEDVDGIVIEYAEDAQVFVEEQKEM